MSQQRGRKPFVAPSIKEQASLVGVTLISGGGNTFRSKGKKGKKGEHENHGHRHS